MSKAPITTEQTMKIEDVPVGEYVRKLRRDGTPYTQTFTREKFCRFTKKYELNGEWDASYNTYVKKGTLVLVGFTY